MVLKLTVALHSSFAEILILQAGLAKTFGIILYFSRFLKQNCTICLILHFTGILT